MKKIIIKMIKRPAVILLIFFSFFFLAQTNLSHHVNFTKNCYAEFDFPGSYKYKKSPLTGSEQSDGIFGGEDSIVLMAQAEIKKEDGKNGKEFSEKLDELKKERDKLKIKLKELQDELSELKKRYNEIANMLEKEKEARTLLEQRLEGVSLRKKRLEEAAIELEEQKKKIVAKYKKKEEELKEKINKASGDEKIALEKEYENAMEQKYDDLYELREKEKKHQEAVAEMELDLQAQLDEERFARMEAEEEVRKLREEKKKSEEERKKLEEEKEKIIEEMRLEAEQQKKLLERASEEEKKKLEEEFKKTQQEKEKALETLRSKLEEASDAEKLEGELRAKLELELKKKFEKMLKEELEKSIMASGLTPTTKVEKPKPKEKIIAKAPKEAKPDKEKVEKREIPYDVEFENIFEDSGLCSNWITTVYEDETDVWVGTKNKGVSRFIKNEGNWICYSRLEGLSGDEISSIVRYDNSVYVGTDLGISRFDGTDWSTIGSYKNVAFNNTLLKIHDNLLWIAARTMYGGLVTFDGQNWEDKTLMKPGEVLNNISCFEFQGNTLWIGTTKNGIYKYDGVNWDVLKVANGLVSNFIYSIAIDGDNVWIGSCCGLVRYNSKTSEITILDKRDGLAHDSVYNIGIDGQAVWFATKGGLSMYDGYDFVNYTKAEGLPNNRLTALLVTPEHVWFGTVVGLTKAIKEY